MRRAFYPMGFREELLPVLRLVGCAVWLAVFSILWYFEVFARSQGENREIVVFVVVFHCAVWGVVVDVFISLAC